MSTGDQPPYTLEILPDRPVVLIHPEPGLTIAALIEPGMGDLFHLLDTADRRLFLVVDLREVTADLDGLMRAATWAARGRSPILHHPMLAEAVVISINAIVRMAAKGLATATFGFARVLCFATPDEALDYCSDRLGALNPDR